MRERLKVTGHSCIEHKRFWRLRGEGAMVHLFLSETNLEGQGDGEDGEIGKRILSLLNQLESLLWPLVTSGACRSEARLWLCNTVSGITSIPPHRQRDLFLSLLRSEPVNWGFASQLLQLVFEKRKREVGRIIAKRSRLLKKLFQGNPSLITQWFSNFAYGGGLENKLGARALSQFAFVNRDTCWGELEWKGKHGQSPAVVATKPHYFLDLDVQRTVENFIDYVPEFWSSSEFADSLKDGSILFIDKKFFTDLFIDLMYKEDARDVWEVVNEFLAEESFCSLCQHLIVVLEEQDLATVLEMLGKLLNQRMQSNDFTNTGWLEFVLSRCSSFKSIDKLLLLNAAVNQGRQLLRLVRDEEYHEENAKIKDVVSQICLISNRSNILVPILNECFKMKTIEGIKLLGLQSWALHYALSEECKTSESWESLFLKSGVSFRRSDNYGMVPYDELSEENDSEFDKTSRKRKHHKKRKRRRNLLDYGSYEYEPLDFDASGNRAGLQTGDASWFLSTDGFSASWTKADLPEHLSKLCFATWMKWASKKLSEAS